jgi:glycine cleavage system H protein
MVESKIKYYFKTHEWLESLSEKTYRMGISDYACGQLGDIVFLEEKPAGSMIEQGSSLAILESVKAVGDVYAPFPCKLIQTNPALISNPELLNAKTWIVEIEVNSPVDLSKQGTLSEAEYQVLFSP